MKTDSMHKGLKEIDWMIGRMDENEGRMERSENEKKNRKGINN